MEFKKGGGSIMRKEPFAAIGGKNGLIVTPLAYLITGLLILPSAACLSVVWVLGDALAAWGDLIVITITVSTPCVTLIGILAAAWAYVAGKRASAMRSPDTQTTNVFGQGMKALPTPMVTIEKPKEETKPTTLPEGRTPWRIRNIDKSKLPKIRRRKSKDEGEGEAR